jgi:HPt (histidine-containing phosphotransfer) domain-containing protein
MDDYMTKPVQLADLKAMLRKWTPAAPAALAEPAPPVDLRVLEALVGSEPAVIAELVADFRVTAAEAARQMNSARASRDHAAVGEIAHRLRSSARSMGALTLGEACARMELASKGGESDLFSGALWNRFHEEIGAVDDFLASVQAGSLAALPVAV